MLTIAEIMTPRPVMTGPEETVSRALSMMRERGISSILVAPPAGEDAVGPELTVWEAAARLSRTTQGRLPVVQGGRTIGVVSEADILRALEEREGGD